MRICAGRATMGGSTNALTFNLCRKSLNVAPVLSETAGTPLGPYRVIRLPRSAIGALELRSSERRSPQDAMCLISTLFRRTNHGNLREFRKSPHKHDTSHTVTTRETQE